MHFDAAVGLIIDRIMSKAPDIDIATELAIDTLQEIEVEGCSDSAAVVIGRDQNRRVLLQVDADEKRGATPEQARGIDEKSVGFRVGEIADGRAGEEAELAWPPRHHRQRAGLGEV